MRRLGLLIALIACVIPVATTGVAAHSQSADHQTSLHLNQVPRASKKLGALLIPALRINTPIYEGVTESQFNIGVGQWPGSPQPGTNGNIVIGGHRTAANRPFANIDKLKNGDEMFLVRNRKKFRYVVSKKLIVTKTAIWIVHPTSTPTLTLFSCHPKGKTSHRYVIRATFVS